ncbi:hypothetical protein D3C87_2077260 [compost metagenome]
MTITARLVSSIGVEKMVSDSGITPISFSIGWPGVEISTGMLADRPSPYRVKPLYAAAMMSG